MTALNCFVTSNAVHFATDGAAYLTDGSPCGQNQKVAILAHLPAIIAVRGPIALAQIVAANAAPLFCTFDELVAAAPEHLRATHAAYIANMESRGLGDLTPRQAEFVIAGHSQDRDSLEGYLLRTSPGSGLEAWTLYPIPDDLISPVSDRIIKAASEIAADVGAPTEAPEAWATRLVEAQRTHPLKMENGREVAVAGAFCQLTTLTRSDISTKILRRWPEVAR